MIRLEYVEKSQGRRVEWFRDKEDAMKRVRRENIKDGQYDMRFVGFRFSPSNSNTDTYSDPDGNLIQGEEGAVLHWLNRYAV